MANTQTTNRGSLRSLLDKKLNGVNFVDWERNLRIVLKYEHREYVIDNALPQEPAAGSARATQVAFQKHLTDTIEVACIMLGAMEGDLQKNFMELSHDPFEMMRQIKEMFKEKARIERYNTLRDLHACKMSAGSSVSQHVLKMKGYLDHLTRLGLGMEKEMAAVIVL